MYVYIYIYIYNYYLEHGDKLAVRRVRVGDEDRLRLQQLKRKQNKKKRNEKRVRGTLGVKVLVFVI